jgi:hypothetical protein
VGFSFFLHVGLFIGLVFVRFGSLAKSLLNEKRVLHIFKNTLRSNFEETFYTLVLRINSISYM